MVDKIHYRWDFIGLSTDAKPTPAESPKVVDGSTFYESNTSKLYVFYKDTWYEKTATGGGGGTSDFDELTNRPKYDGTAMTGETEIPNVLGTTETYTIATGDWTALSSSSPYDYSSTVTATYTIGANTIAELINDDPVAFANNGFAIGSISSQTVTIYSIGQPTASTTLKINYKG